LLSAPEASKLLFLNDTKETDGCFTSGSLLIASFVV